MKFVLASHNAKKLREMQDKFSALGLEVVPLPEDAPEPVEDGKSFEENAFIKARSAMRFMDMPAIADDSGLVVDALSGAPGIHSARYCEGTDTDRNAFLLQNIKGVEDSARTAHFVCVLACVFPGEDYEQFSVRGECDGVILREARGGGGFGYDPLFFVPSENATFSELTMDQKARISHRGKAIDKCVEKLRGIIQDDLSIKES